MFLGLRTVIYPAPDLPAAKAWWTGVLGIEPYFDEPFYVGYEVGGYELGLRPDGRFADGAVAYWGVADAEEAFAALLAAGATERSPVTDVGGGIRVAEVLETSGAILGIIENPNFKGGSQLRA
jgi:catechol 2,3-dioxygenase-like lactoylglutathione lyase family enzyme